MWSAWSREFIFELPWSEPRNFGAAAAAAATLWNVKVGSVQAAAALSPSSAGVNQQFPPVCTIAAFLSLSPSHLQIKILTCLWMCQRLQSHNSVLVSFGIIAKRFVDFVAVLPLVILCTSCQLSSRSTHSPFRGNSLSLSSIWCFFTLRNLRFISGLHPLVTSFNFVFHILDLCAAYLQRRNTKNISQHVWQENNW